AIRSNGRRPGSTRGCAGTLILIRCIRSPPMAGTSTLCRSFLQRNTTQAPELSQEKAQACRRTFRVGRGPADLPAFRLTGCFQSQGLGQLELKYGFGRDFYSFSSREHLRPGSRASTRGCSDGSTFTTAGNRSDQGSEHSAAADHFRRALVGAEISFTLLSDARCIHDITLTMNFDGGEVKGKFGRLGDPATGNLLDD